MMARGYMGSTTGKILLPRISSSLVEGMTITEILISSWGARRGLLDTAIKTADAGYLTRKLVDSVQHITVRAKECGTKRSIWTGTLDTEVLKNGHYINGRVLAKSLKLTASQDIIPPFTLINKLLVNKLIQANKHNDIYIRTPLTCALGGGVCRLCYGADLRTFKLISLGEAVGIIAGQSIGEPGTQMTLRTFHTGGVA
jgi:DNA-directed RNA polymerase subunit beta'